jgi:hypothetical protein
MMFGERYYEKCFALRLRAEEVSEIEEFFDDAVNYEVFIRSVVCD